MALGALAQPLSIVGFSLHFISMILGYFATPIYTTMLVLIYKLRFRFKKMYQIFPETLQTLADQVYPQDSRDPELRSTSTVSCKNPVITLWGNTQVKGGDGKFFPVGVSLFFLFHFFNC